MMLHRCGNDDGVHVCAVEKLLRLCQAFDVRIQCADMLWALSIEVADGFELAVRKTFEVANQQRSPVAAPDYAYGDLFFHFGADSAKPCKIVVGDRGLFRADFTNVCKIGAGEEGVPSCGSLDSTNCPA